VEEVEQNINCTNPLANNAKCSANRSPLAKDANLHPTAKTTMTNVTAAEVTATPSFRNNFANKHGGRYVQDDLNR
jgi:hypothetical protein